MPGWGQIALSSLLLALISGILLIPAFNSHGEPFRSVSQLTSAHPFGYFLHSIHAYAGDLFLIATIVHTIEYLYKRAYKSYRFKSWFWLVLLLIVSILVVFSGFLSIGSKESWSAAHIFENILASVPAFGSALAVFFAQFNRTANPLSVIYLHHAATFSILTVVLTYMHIRRLKAERYAFVYTFLLLTVVSLLFPSALGIPPDGVTNVVKGPWYFVGLQETLSWLPVWLAGLLLPLIAMVLIAVLPKMKRNDSIGLYALALLTIFYLIESFIGQFLRGEGWRLILG